MGKYINRFYIPLSIIFLTILFFSSYCKHETISIERFDTVYFDRDIEPIFQTNCAYCHNSGNDLNLSSYSGIMNGIKKGDPDGSEIYKAITSVWGEPMPPEKPLTLELRTLIRIWILQGALDNKAPVELPVDTGTNNPTDTIPSITKYPVCFSRDILPVLTANCSTTGCHNSTSQQEGIVISNYTDIKNLVVAGHAGSSKLYQVITNPDPGDRMPPSGPLSQVAIDSIRNWINNGALNEVCPSQCDTNVFTYSGVVKPMVDLKCKSCHNTSNPSKGINLDNYNSVASVAQSGKLVNVLKAASGFSKMPPSGGVDDCTINSVEKWVKAGAKND